MPRQGLAWAFARSSPAHSIVRGQLVAQMGRAAGGSAFGHPAAQVAQLVKQPVDLLLLA